MGKRVPVDVKKSILFDWTHAKYKNYTQLSKAHNLAHITVKRICEKAKAVHGSEKDKYEEIREDHRKALKDYAINPVDEKLKRVEDAKNIIPTTNLTELFDISKEDATLVAKELVEEIEEQLLNSNIILANVNANKSLKKNKKTVVSMGRHGYEKTETELNSKDLLNFVELADKSKVALGLAERFSTNKLETKVAMQLNTSDSNDSSCVATISSDLNSFYDDDEKKSS